MIPTTTKHRIGGTAPHQQLHLPAGYAAAIPTRITHREDAPLEPGTEGSATTVEVTRRVAKAGITATWTGDCSATIVLARLAGPRDGPVSASEARRSGLRGKPPWTLSNPEVRVAVYERVLTNGTQFDCYRWINLIDLATVWHQLHLPHAIRTQWKRVLTASGLAH